MSGWRKKQIEALKLALEALEVANSCVDGYYIPKGKTQLPEVELAITAIKEALAQPEQEPVAMRYDFDGYGWKYIDSGSGSDWQTRIKNAEPLCTTPPQRTWDWLTYEEQEEIVANSHSIRDCVTKTTAKLKQKNGYAEEKNT